MQTQRVCKEVVKKPACKDCILTLSDGTWSDNCFKHQLLIGNVGKLRDRGEEGSRGRH